MDRGELIVRDAKGGRDRVTVLPAAIIVPLGEHLAKLFDRIERERKLREPGVSLPSALVRKYPNAATQWGWQWLFPANSLCRDAYTGALTRQHQHEKIVQRAVQAAVHGLHACNGKGGDGGKKPLGPAALRYFLRLATSAAIP